MMPLSSTYPALDLPKVDVFSFLFKRASIPFPGHKVIYQDCDEPSRKYTFDEIRTAATEFGQGLQSRYNIRKGDVIALCTPNDVDTPIVTCGALYTGAIVSPCNPGYTVSELVHMLKDSGAKLVIVHDSIVKTIKQACAEVGIPDSRILLIGSHHGTDKGLPHWTQVRQKVGNSTQSGPVHIDAKRDLAFLVYSSGTTGRPKGVMITHYNIVSNVLQIRSCEMGKLSWDGSSRTPGIPDAPPTGDKVLACLPFFHIYGLNTTVLSPLYSGVHVLVLAKFEIEKFCRLTQEHKITFIFIVPPMALLLAKHPSVANYDLSSIRMTNSGAAPLTQELQKAVWKRCGIRIKQGYGLSETSPTTHEQRWEDWDSKAGTIGRLQPNMQAMVCVVGSEDGPKSDQPEELPAGETGEIYVKGPNVFTGYWRNKTATADCLSNDGWFRTGDVGYVDKDGDFYITDRVKELIKYKGFQVPPAELEGYLLDHDLVDDVVVVGVESKEYGTEIPRACVVRKGGISAVQPGDEKAIVDWLAKKVTNYKKLRGGIKFVETVPKSASGKLLRRTLKDQVRKEFAEMEARKMKAKL